MDVSVILVNYNTSKLTQAAIRSVYEKTENVKYEIIVVDNASIDNSVDDIKLAYPSVKVIVNKKNIGFGRANNLAMSQAKGKYFFLLNTDAYLMNNAIGIFYQFMEDKTNTMVSVVGGHMFRENGNECVSAANFPNFKLFVKGSFWKHFYNQSFYKNEKSKGLPERKLIPYEVDYVSGADFFVRKSIIKTIGGFNKRFFLYFEETELCLRIRRKIQNSKIMIVPQAQIVHIGQGSDNKGVKSKKFRLIYLKSKATYFSIQNGVFAGVMVYLKGLINIFIYNK